MSKERSAVYVVEHEGIGAIIRGEGHRYIVHVQIGKAVVRLEFEPGYEQSDRMQFVDLTPEAPHPEPRP